LLPPADRFSGVRDVRQQTSTRRRCAVTGCGRFVGRDDERCPAHRRGRAATSDTGNLVAVAEPAGQSPLPRSSAVGSSRRGPAAIALPADIEAELAGEIGALRVAMARLLAEESDPGRLAQGVARVAAATIQAVRAQRALAADPRQTVASTVVRLLSELDAVALDAIEADCIPAFDDERSDQR